MVSKIKRTNDKLIVDECLSKGMSPQSIQKMYGISRTGYYRYVKEIFEEMTSEEAQAQYDSTINASYEGLMEVIFQDLAKCEDNIDLRAKVLSNAIKITKDRLDYYLKTGKIKEEAKEINVNARSVVMTEIDFIQKYLVEGDSDKEIKELND